MIERARDLVRDDPTLSTEAVAHTLFEEFRELAQRDHVPDEYLRKMAMGHAAQIMRVRALVAEWKAKEKEKKK